MIFSLQNDVYEATMKNLVGDVLSGFNVTVFAYGPTGQVPNTSINYNIIIYIIYNI